MGRGIGQRLRDLGHARRYARMRLAGQLSDLANAVRAYEVGDALHDRWLLAGLAWEWRLPADRIGRDLFAELVGQRSELAAATRTGRRDQGDREEAGGAGSVTAASAPAGTDDKGEE